MISTAEARYLLAQWVSAELAEIRQECYYPESAPAFRDYQSGYRRSSGDPSERDLLLVRVGSALTACKPVNKATLLKAFMDGDRVGKATLGVALDDFRRTYSAMLDAPPSDERTCPLVGSG